MIIRLCCAAAVALCPYAFAAHRARLLERSADTALCISNDLHMLASHIDFTRPDLPTAFSVLAKRRNTGIFWQECASAVRAGGVNACSSAFEISEQLCMSDTTKELLGELFTVLGTSDADDQKRLILLCRDRVCSEYEQIKAQLTGSAALKKRAALLIGSAAAIALV